MCVYVCIAEVCFEHPTHKYVVPIQVVNHSAFPGLATKWVFFLLPSSHLAQ